MKQRIAYGRGAIDVEVPDDAKIVEAAQNANAISDERFAFTRAVRAPIGSRPLREVIGPEDRVVIVTSDVTRATPNERLIPWILDELAHVAPERITVIIGTGSHRSTTPEEMRQMFGEDVLRRVRVIDHDAHDDGQVTRVGTTAAGIAAYLNTDYVRADKRIVVGFIEPHFYAGFSGGPKGVMPGVAGIRTVTYFHSAKMIGDPRTTWLNLDRNPVQEMSREVTAMAPPDFLVNVTLDRDRAITGFFCGQYLEAHARGAAHCKSAASQGLDERFDVVLTGNGGYPLDQNLYQCGKGLTAAARIVKPGGTIVLCAECSDGFPEHGNFKRLVSSRETPADLLAMIEEPGFATYDQWAAHSQALVQLQARVVMYSSIPDAELRAALLEPTHDPSSAVREALAQAGDASRCAVLPEGPYVVPYLNVFA
jgi:nickel-dependent lactate racemase